MLSSIRGSYVYKGPQIKLKLLTQFADFLSELVHQRLLPRWSAPSHH